MARTLEVWWDLDRVGLLEQDESGRLSFRYCDGWLNGAGALPISFSMPLTDQPYDDKAAHAFFGGLLQEGEKRNLIERLFGVTPRNDYALLDAIGGDCAGALTLLPPGQEPQLAPKKIAYEPLTADELESILDRLPSKPLLAGENGGFQAKKMAHLADGSFKDSDFFHCWYCSLNYRKVDWLKEYKDNPWVDLIWERSDDPGIEGE